MGIVSKKAFMKFPFLSVHTRPMKAFLNVHVESVIVITEIAERHRFISGGLYLSPHTILLSQKFSDAR